MRRGLGVRASLLEQAHIVNWVRDFGGAPGPGHEAPNTSALPAFNMHYASRKGTTTLIIPEGTYVFSSDPNWAALGGQNLIISAYGASLPNSGVANVGLYNDNAHHANIRTVSAGASTVSLVNAG